MKTPRMVIDLRPEVHAGEPRCQGPTRCDKSFDFGEFLVVDELADLDHHATGGTWMGPSARGGVFDGVGFAVADRHLPPAIWEPVGDPGNHCRDDPRNVQTAEPHGSPPVGGYHVGADIGLGKRRPPTERRTSWDADSPHVERDQTDPRSALAGVDSEALGQQALDRSGVVRPVNGREIVPALQHDRSTNWSGAFGRDRFGGTGHRPWAGLA
jgi:hypothetical protein